MKNSVTERFECLVFTPLHLDHPGLAIAAAQAGAVPVFDFEYAASEYGSQIQANFRRFLDATDAGTTCYGIRSTPEQLARCLEWIGTEETPLCDRIILHGWMSDKLAATLDEIEPTGCRLFLEVTSASEIEPIREYLPKIDGLVGKGNESGGRVGTESSYVLIQKLIDAQELPVYVRGGIGAHSAAACRVLGASGIVLDDTLWLFPESPLCHSLGPVLRRVDVKDSIIVGAELGAGCRFLQRPDLPAARGLVDHARQLEAALERRGESAVQAEWLSCLSDELGFEEKPNGVMPVLPLGPLAVFSDAYAKRFKSLARYIHHILSSSTEAVKQSRLQSTLAPDSPMAVDHGTRYPIVQGPMTRVSDRAEFAVRLAESGGLPMLALALMRAEQVKTLLDETRASIGDQAWGVGLLGFAPKDLLDAQIKEVLRVKPGFALLAGGRPTQAGILEAEGIKTYIHAPVPSLLTNFLEQGARRFVLEGRECGGHVGPLSSFVLWEEAIEVLLRHSRSKQAEPVSVLFAGGIHDRRSAAMVAAMAAPLVDAGARVGVLMGTPYIFTQEAVETGAIMSEFQQQARICERTTIIESSPGHQIRCSTTPFMDEFRRARRSYLEQGLSGVEIKDALEHLSLGRLRIASKGVTRSKDGGLEEVSAEDQVRDGMYMLGDTATMHADTCSLEELHREVSIGCVDWLQELDFSEPPREPVAARPCQVAVVGMAAFLPGAEDVDAYWRNLLDLEDSMKEIPQEYWDWRLYYQDLQSGEERNLDQTVSKWGGFIKEVPFNPIQYGIPPNSLKRISPAQLLALESVYRTVQDAGYSFDEIDRENTSVIFGTDGSSPLKGHFIFRTLMPLFHYRDDSIMDRLPEWGEEAFPGILANVGPGRVANRFDLGGTNFVVDAACASSLKAIDLAVQELESGRSNCVIAGGVDIDQSPEAYVAFSSSHALSPTGRVRTFDQSADGIVISEGISVVMLKRLEDAERDGDRIYSVIQGVGSSSDGKALGLTAPNTSGQKRAFERAYRLSGVDPKTLGYYEAHGTGTVLGDRTELQSFHNLLSDSGAEPQSCAIGSHKTLIGHTKTAAGVTGLIKSSLSLYHRVLPPHKGVEAPIDGVQSKEDPVCIMDRASPWCAQGQKRRSAVSAFGFGGTNTHIVLEEYTASGRDLAPGAAKWPCELCIFTAKDEISLVNELSGHLKLLESAESKIRLSDYAYSLAHEAETKTDCSHALTVIAQNLEELRKALESTLKILSESQSERRFPSHIRFAAARHEAAKIAFVFPGQGAQYINMARESALYFDEIRSVFERANQALDGCYEKPLSRYVFPSAAFTEADREEQRSSLTDTHVAQVAIGSVSLGYYHLLERLGISPDAVCGHSYGEFVALHVAGAYSEEAFLKLSEVRGREMASASALGGGMLVCFAERQQITELAREIGEDLCISNHNAPRQVVLAGTTDAVERMIAVCDQKEIRYRRLNVAGPFHSSLMEPAKAPLVEAIRSVEWSEPKIPVYSNMDGECYPEDIDGLKDCLERHLLHSVEFVSQIEQMHADGVDLFIECGPNGLFSKMIGQILEGEDHLALSLDRDEGAISHLLGCLAQLFNLGVWRLPLRLFSGRDVTFLDFAELRQQAAEARSQGPAPLWYVDGSGCRAANEKLKHPGKLSPLTYEESLELMEKQQRLETGQSPGHHNGSHNGEHVVIPSSQTSKNGTSHASGTPSASPAAAKPQTLHSMPMPTSNVGGLQPSEALAAYESYQQTMQQFLKMEESIMTRFLQGGVAPPHDVGDLKNSMVSAPAPEFVAAPSHAVSNSNGVAPSDMLAEPTSRAPESPPQVPVNAAEEMPQAAESSAASPAATEVAESTTVDTPDRAQMQASLLGLVSQLTGYPEDLLELDSDLESELGIDSIKRIEILTKVMDLLPSSMKKGLNAQFEHLTQIKTLSGILDEFEAFLESAAAETSAPVSSEKLVKLPSGPINATDALSESTCPLSVMVSERTELPAVLDRASLGAGLYLLTDGPVELVAAVTRLLKARGASVTVLETADYMSAERLKARVSALREQMPIAGIIHLAGIGDKAWPDNFDELKTQTRMDTKSFFQLIQLCRENLMKLSEKGGGQVVSVSHLDGLFGRGGSRIAGFPTVGSSVGLLKTLHTESEGLHLRALDFDGQLSVEDEAEKIVAETLIPGDAIEIGYQAGVRHTFHAEIVERMEAPNWKQTVPPSRENWVVLATGGARGITAEILKRYAEPGMQIVLVGRSPVGEAPVFEGADAEDVDSLRKALIAEMQGRNAKITPAAIESELRSILGQRERLRNLRDLEARGAVVSYHAVDVADEAVFKPFLEELYSRFERIDAVFHGAGVLEDKLIADKTLDSFDRVFDVKVDSTFLLTKHLKPDSLRELVLFSSIAGRFGNRGQVDYAAANEALNRFAWVLDRSWEQTRVVSMNWGPWASAGMAVDPQIAAQFQKQGIVPIDTEDGSRVMLEVLNSQIAPDAVEIIAGLGNWVQGGPMIAG
ncbi:MAG: SDR family NAD(P)-dependent oxidoreductase [Verrucomicrobiota bacterium]